MSTLKKTVILPGVVFTPFSESQLALLNKWANSGKKKRKKPAQGKRGPR